MATVDPLGGLSGDIEIPSMVPMRKLLSVNLWANVDKCRTNWHYDCNHNLLCCVTGRKTVELRAPALSGVMCVTPIYAASPNHSQLPLHVTAPVTSSGDEGGDDREFEG